MTAVLTPLQYHQTQSALFQNISSSTMMSGDSSPLHSPFSCSQSIQWPKCTTISTQSYGIENAAKTAVVDMGFPGSLVQLAIDIRLLEHGTGYSAVTELYLAVEELSLSPEKQAVCHMRLYQHAQKQIQQVPPQKSKQIDCPSPHKKIDCFLDNKTDLLDHSTGQLLDAASQEVLQKGFASVVSAGLSAEMSKEAVSVVAGEKSEIQKKVQELARENQRLKERKMCRACRKVELAASGITFLPCGHFVTCETCSEMFDDCPACGKNIMGTVRTFLS